MNFNLLQLLVFNAYAILTLASANLFKLAPFFHTTSTAFDSVSGIFHGKTF